MSDINCSSTIPKPFGYHEYAASVLMIGWTVFVIMVTIDDSWITEKWGFLRGFSLTLNLPKMLSTEISSNDIPCLHGLRVIGSFWIIAFHRYISSWYQPSLNYETMAEQIQSISYAPLYNGLLNVEIFFFISGVLVTYTYLRKCSKGTQDNIFTHCLRRYMRLLPNLTFAVILYSTIAARATDGPTWIRVLNGAFQSCKQYWWSTLLFIQNYYNPTEICLVESWHLAADFQMYVFSPLLLIPLHKKPVLGLVLTVLLLVYTTVAGIWNNFTLQLRAGGLFTMDRRTEYTIINDYLHTHVRAETFLIGIATGYLITKINEGHLSINLSKRVQCIGWLSSIFCIVFSVYFAAIFHQEDYVYNEWLEVLYQAFYRLIFSIGLAWIVLVCILGHGGFVNDFLSWKIFVPLGRLTYASSFMNVMVQAFVYSSRTPVTLDIFFMINNIVGDVLLSYFFSAVLYLFVEAPFNNITSIIFKEKEKKE